uniref:Uncharacterized protein n=1 Tax=Anguilla anguilla TaxID=7936 RepID=A0A0E9UCF9_ANGAN
MLEAGGAFSPPSIF